MPIPQSLHLLLIRFQVQFKMLVVSYKALYGLRPIFAEMLLLRCSVIYKMVIAILFP